MSNWQPGREKLYDILNGIWSGIPLCCIKYWYDGNTGLSRDKEDPYRDEARYVRCNRCVSKRRIKQIRHNGDICRFLSRRWPHETGKFYQPSAWHGLSCAWTEDADKIARCAARLERRPRNDIRPRGTCIYLSLAGKRLAEGQAR